MAADIRSYLDAGEDVAYFAAITPDGVVGKKAVVGEEAANIQGFVATEGAVAAGQVVITEDEVMYEVGAVDDDEVVYEAGVVPAEDQTPADDSGDEDFKRRTL